ncbi:MAG: lytic transglycosylase domain-containing protein [Lachnospiraceae bacterium]|nr:lytic transglycosylase domain-containing protein [Lachnospiraceae bacterium]
MRNLRRKRRWIAYCCTAVVVLLIVLLVRSCGRNKEQETEQMAETAAEAIAEGETETKGRAETEEATESEIAAEETETEEETETVTKTPVTHDIPDISDLEFPFTTMSLDWGEDTLEGWWHYDIPEEYEQTGGYLPDAVQVYTYALCTQNNIDYAMVLAIIEAESGYKWDAVSKTGALGYMQVVPSYHSERLSIPQSDEAFINPYLNIGAGISFLVELSERFDSQEMVLTAYHYGVTGSYRDYWNKGATDSPYSDEVLEIAQRIQSQLDERAEEAQAHGE